MVGVREDFSYGLRTLVRNPGFTLIAVFTLALGIGASAAIFSVIDHVLLEPFPYTDSNRLMTVQIEDADQSGADPRSSFTTAEFRDYYRHSDVFDVVIGHNSTDVLYTTQEGTERFNGQLVTPNTLETLGVPPLLGRTLQSQNILRLIVGQGARMASAGILLGLLASFALTRLLASMLFEVKPADPLIFAAVSALLLAVSLLASYIPARRAMRVDPNAALHHE